MTRSSRYLHRRATSASRITVHRSSFTPALPTRAQIRLGCLLHQVPARHDSGGATINANPSRRLNPHYMLKTFVLFAATLLAGCIRKTPERLDRLYAAVQADLLAADTSGAEAGA